MRDRVTSPSTAVGSPAATPPVRFSNGQLKPHAWRRFVTLAKHAYGPLLIYAALGIALVAALAIRVATWVPMAWH